MLKLLNKRGWQSLETCHRYNNWKHLHTGVRIGSAHFDNIVPPRQAFKTRHIGPNEAEQQQMLKVLGCQVTILQQKKIQLLWMSN